MNIDQASSAEIIRTDQHAVMRLMVLLDAQKRALEMMLEKAPLAEVLAHLAKTVEEQAEGRAVASILLLDAEGALRRGASPSLPEDYQQAIDGLKMDPRVVTCAAAAATGEIVITPDFSTDPSWSAYRHLPLGIGLVAAWSMPIKARDGSVLGTFGTYFRERRGPFPEEMQSVEILARTAALAIERERSEAARIASELDFRTLADNMSQLAWMTDEKGSHFWFNQRWFEYSGATLDDMRGNGWFSLCHPEHRERVASHMQACWQSGQAWEDLFPLRGKDGEYRWFLSRAVPVRDEAGNVIRWFGTNTDVTEARRAQEALRESDQRKDQFLAVLAHELRNPLAPLANALHILRIKRSDPQLTQKLHEMMERQVGYMVRLVDDLMEVSRISRGKIELRKERLDLRAALQNAIETSRPLIDGARHRLHVEMPDQPIAVDADAVRLMQVFANLLNNAARYTPKGGDIRIQIRAAADHAQVVVSDSGKGIDASMLASIFELFVQGAARGNSSSAGLGVGLTLARELAQFHGGSIEAKSAGAGRGAEFIVRLPLAHTGRDAGPPEPQGPERLLYRILVVDDNRDAADSLAALLCGMGADAQTAYDGRSALEAVARLRPEVVLLDLGMAGMDGYETARRLREQAGTEGMSLIALTGWNQESDRMRTAAAGFDAHLSKPAELDKLIATLHRLQTKHAGHAVE